MSHSTRSLSRSELISWAAHLGAVTAEALACREDLALRSARARLVAAVRDGQLVRHRPLVDSPTLYTVTRAGLRMAGLDGLGPSRVSAAGAQHMTVCAYAAAALERGYPDQLVIGERELRRREREAGKLLASVPLDSSGAGKRRLHRPDLVLLPEAGRPGGAVAVEVELTVKAPSRLLAICRAWARAHHVEGVLYLVSPRVASPLERAIALTRAGQRIVLVPLAALVTDDSALRPS
jgi:hypothetical protein